MNLKRIRLVAKFVLPFLLVLFAFLFCLYSGRRGIHPLDQPIVFDGAYRILSGQLLYGDFQAPVGPVTFLLQALVFRLFGVSWNSMIATAAICNVAAAFLVTRIVFYITNKSIFYAYVAGFLTAVWFYPPFGTVVIVGDKSPSSLLNGRAVKLMHKVYPDGQLIFIVRDGRDAALSHRFQAFIDQPQYLSKDDQKIRDAIIQNPGPFLRGDQSVFTEQGICQAAKSWLTNVEETEAYSQRLYEKTHYSLRYEDLLLQPWNELVKIWLFLGAKSPKDDLVDIVNHELNQNPDAQWQQEKASEIAGIVQKGKQGSWKDMFTARDRDIYWSIAGETLTKWGYLR